MLKSICLGIGLNMFFPEYVLLVDSPPSVKSVFFKPGFNRRGENKGVNRVNNQVHFNRTQNK
jgi:hypothetical protein